MFYFFYKIIFRRKKEKDNIRSAYVYFDFFDETVNSHNLETANHIANNENTLLDRSKRAYYPNYFIIDFVMLNNLKEELLKSVDE